MTPTATVLLTIAAFAHAGWNLLGKRENPSAAFFLVANTLGFIWLAPALFLYGHALKAFPVSVWGLLIITGIFQAIYYVGLAGAYRHGDMSVAYPLARATPVILVALLNLLLGRADQLSMPAMFGIALIAAGCLVLPMRRFSEFNPHNYLRLSTLFALIAAVGTCGYSMIDDAALRIIRTTPDLPVSAAAATALFAFFEGAASSFWQALFVLARKKDRATLGQVWRTQARQAMLTGFGIYLAYTLVLVSMAFVRNVSYVVAFRQSSILIGTAFGMLILQEERYAPKLIGVAILFVGLVLVGMG